MDLSIFLVTKWHRQTTRLALIRMSFYRFYIVMSLYITATAIRTAVFNLNAYTGCALHCKSVSMLLRPTHAIALDGVNLLPLVLEYRSLLQPPVLDFINQTASKC